MKIKSVKWFLYILLAWLVTYFLMSLGTKTLNIYRWNDFALSNLEGWCVLDAVIIYFSYLSTKIKN